METCKLTSFAPNTYSVYLEQGICEDKCMLNQVSSRPCFESDGTT